MTNDTASARLEAHYEGSGTGTAREMLKKRIAEIIDGEVGIRFSSQLSGVEDAAEKIAALTPSSPLLGEGEERRLLRLFVEALTDNGRKSGAWLHVDHDVLVQLRNRAQTVLRSERAAPPPLREEMVDEVFGLAICSDCPPVGYPKDSTRCTPCPRRSPSSCSIEETQELRKALAVGLHAIHNDATKATERGRRIADMRHTLEAIAECAGELYEALAQPLPPTDDDRALHEELKWLKTRIDALYATSTDDVRARACELLAVEYEAAGNKAAAFTLRQVGAVGGVLEIAVRAIERALSAQSPPPPSSPMRLHFNNDWLRKKIAEEGDVEIEAADPEIVSPPSSGEAEAVARAIETAARKAETYLSWCAYSASPIEGAQSVARQIANAIRTLSPKADGADHGK